MFIPGPRSRAATTIMLLHYSTDFGDTTAKGALVIPDPFVVSLHADPACSNAAGTLGLSVFSSISQSCEFSALRLCPLRVEAKPRSQDPECSCRSETDQDEA